MGETLRVERGDRVEISVAFHSPEANDDGDAPRVDHIDLIAGRVAGKAKPGTRAYGRDATRPRGSPPGSPPATGRCENGTCRARIDAGTVSGTMYFRLRGTNLPPSTPGETDEEGNPLPDDEACGNDGRTPPKCNTREKAYADLWFYSEPDLRGLYDRALPI